MSYQSFEFLLFSAVAVLAYYIAGKTFPSGRKYILLAANIGFYLFCGIKYVPFLAVTLVSSYLAAKKIGKIYAQSELELQNAESSAQKKEIRNAAKTKAKKSMLVGALISLAILVVCKYTSFILGNVNIVMKMLDKEPITVFRIILPIGISFYTFMAVGYVLDVYLEKNQG